MPLYKFECDGCGAQDLQEMSIAAYDEIRADVSVGYFVHMGDAGKCGVFRRIYNFYFTKPFEEHYNHSIGARVTSQISASDAVKRHEEEQSIRMGYDQHYELVDPHDAASVGATDHGLEETERRHHNTHADGHKHIFT